MASAPATSFRNVRLPVLAAPDGFAIVSRLRPRFPSVEDELGLVGVFHIKADATAWMLLPLTDEPRKVRIQDKPTTTEWGELAQVDDLVREGALELQRRIRKHLEEDTEDDAVCGEVAPTQFALTACLRLGERLAPHLVLAPGLKYAAFTEEAGMVGLVLQSLVTDRRVTCRFTSDGRQMEVLRLSEKMRIAQATVAVDDVNVPRELAEWVIKRA